MLSAYAYLFLHSNVSFSTDAKNHATLVQPDQFASENQSMSNSVKSFSVQQENSDKIE